MPATEIMVALLVAVVVVVLVRSRRPTDGPVACPDVDQRGPAGGLLLAHAGYVPPDRERLQTPGGHEFAVAGHVLSWQTVVRP
jgi:hypothetical protein